MKETIIYHTEFLKDITIAGYTGILALTTVYQVDTDTLYSREYYRVKPWNTKHKRLTKDFMTYKQACQYYQKLYSRFKA